MFYQLLYELKQPESLNVTDDKFLENINKLVQLMLILSVHSDSYRKQGTRDFLC